MVKLSLREIVSLGLLSGLHFVFNLAFLKIYVPISMGTISFKSLPLILMALKFNFIISFMSLNLCAFFAWIFSGYPIYTLMFDYFVPYVSFSLLSVLSFLTKKKPRTEIILFLLFDIFVIRLLSHALSGFLFYEVSFLVALWSNFLTVFINDFVNAVIVLIYLKINNKNKEDENHSIEFETKNI